MQPSEIICAVLDQLDGWDGWDVHCWCTSESMSPLLSYLFARLIALIPDSAIYYTYVKYI
jgi:hypothetical protein